MIEAVGIVMPANDEETLIGEAVEALEVARARVSAPIDTFLVVVLDACVDRSRARAEPYLRGPHRLTDVSYANVGRARAHGAELALRHFAHRDLSRVWLATTDADSRVSPRWLVEHIAIANTGVDALAGVIQIDDWTGHSPAQARAFRRFYEGARVQRSHGHVHGSNLGVRANAYVEVGGFEELATGEDHALWNALERSGKRLASERTVVVTTSSRLVGRAPNGFAGFLADHRRRLTG
jgi:hypothetical protein